MAKYWELSKSENLVHKCNEYPRRAMVHKLRDLQKWHGEHGISLPLTILLSSQALGHGRSVLTVACAPSPSHRHLWQHVTNSLKEGNIDAATEHKHHLEERQRAEERQRVALTVPWKPKYFAKEVLSLSYFKDPIACFCIQEDASKNEFVCGFYHGIVLLHTTECFKFYFCQSLALKEEQWIFYLHIVNLFTFLQLDLF